MPGNSDYWQPSGHAAKQMNEPLTKALDPEHELPSNGARGGFQKSDKNGQTTGSQGKAFKADLQNDDNDPARLRERLVRLQADFENARKRSIKEQQDAKEYAAFEVAKALLPVVDSLDQALLASSSGSADLRTGIGLTQKQLLDVLFKMGVRPIHALGEHFDPRIHHAVATADTDLVEDQTVVGELQRGYKFKDRLLRPAMVTVARRIPPDLSQSPSSVQQNGGRF
jgi:molecular chaperone GrpE